MDGYFRDLEGICSGGGVSCLSWVCQGIYYKKYGMILMGMESLPFSGFNTFGGGVSLYRIKIY